MNANSFRLPLHLPAQGAAETEATIIEWLVAEGDVFEKGAVLAQIDSAKSVFDFSAPCQGRVIRRFHLDGETVTFTEPVLEIETSDPAMRDWQPPAPAKADHVEHRPAEAIDEDCCGRLQDVVIRGLGGYLPQRIVDNDELVQEFPQVTADYVYQVTGIRQRHWAAHEEKPSDMALAASLEAIRRAGIATKDIDAVLVATTTPDVAMPSTACILRTGSAWSTPRPSI